MTDPADAAPKLTVAQAKANLIAQGEATQREVEALVERARLDVSGVVARFKHTVPWAAAAALGAGLLIGRRGRQRVAGNAAERLRWLATTLGPMAWELFLKSRAKRSER